MKAMNYHRNRFKAISHQPNYKLGIRSSHLPHVNNSKLTSGRAVNNVQVIPVLIDENNNVINDSNNLAIIGKEVKVLRFKHILHYPA